MTLALNQRNAWNIEMHGTVARRKQKTVTTTRRTMTRLSFSELSVYFSRGAIINSLQKHSSHTWLRETSWRISIALLNFRRTIHHSAYQSSLLLSDLSRFRRSFHFHRNICNFWLWYEGNKIRILKFNSNLLAYCNCFSDHLSISLTEGRGCNRILSCRNSRWQHICNCIDEPTCTVRRNILHRCRLTWRKCSRSSSWGSSSIDLPADPVPLILVGSRPFIPGTSVS